MKVSELTGALLDYWVARAMGAEPRKVAIIGGICVLYDQETAPWPLQINCMPSTDWAQGGPIIEKARIDLTSPDDGSGIWWAYCWDEVLQENFMYQGETALIASMRAYVGSKLGPEVEDLP